MEPAVLPGEYSLLIFVQQNELIVSPGGYGGQKP